MSKTFEYLRGFQDGAHFGSGVAIQGFGVGVAYWMMLKGDDAVAKKLHNTGVLKKSNKSVHGFGKEVLK